MRRNEAESGYRILEERVPLKPFQQAPNLFCQGGQNYAQNPG